MNKAILAGIIVIVVAVAAVGGYMAFGGQDGGGDGNGDAPESDATALEYVVNVIEVPGNDWDLNIEFYAPESGSFSVFIGDEPLLGGHGDQISYSWSGFKHVDLTYGFIDSKYSYAYASSNISVVFSYNFDAERVYSL